MAYAQISFRTFQEAMGEVLGLTIRNGEKMGVSIVTGVPQNGWFVGEHPRKMDDLEVPLFQETAKWWLLKPKTIKSES